MKTKAPVSEARAAAARANGAKSHGPITPAGKYNSSLNAIRHAIFARCLVIPGESKASFQQMFDEFHDSLRPRTPVERALVEEMVTSWWRKQRIWSMEGAHIAREIDDRDQHNRSEPSDTPAVCASRALVAIAGRERILDLFLRYETRYERQFHRAHQRLMFLKSRPLDATPDLPIAPPRDSSFPPRDSSFPSRDSNGAVDCVPTPFKTQPNEKLENAQRTQDVTETNPPAPWVPPVTQPQPKPLPPLVDP